MKFLAIASALFVAAVSAQNTMVFKVTKWQPGFVIDMTCSFNKTTASGLALSSGKYERFLHNSTYTHNVFDCVDIPGGKDCWAAVEDAKVCETGYEGEFCRNYGGKDAIVDCYN